MSSASALGQDWYFCEDLNKICINFSGLEKTSRPNRLRTTLKLDNGLPGLEIKPVIALYLERTAQHRNESSKLFVSLVKPYENIQSVTCRNIFLDAMAAAGIDTSRFKAHSARASVTSAPGLTLKQVLELGCWRQASTFKRFYEAEVEK